MYSRKISFHLKSISNIYSYIHTLAGVCHDPHFTTFDGRAYAYQGEGWHTMFKDCSDIPAFEVDAKFDPRDDSTAEHIKTRTVAFNVTVGDQYASVNGLDVVTVSFVNV